MSTDATNAMAANDDNGQGTVLLDSFLHPSLKRVGVGIFSGLLAGVVMIFVSSLFQVETAGKLWWLQLTASAVFGGKAFLLSAPTSVFLVGAIVHFACASLCGFMVGKMTKANAFGRMLFYTFVLGFLCWLGSNMFGPDFLDYQFLQSVGQWMRLAIFMSFTLSLGVIMCTLGRILKV